MSALLPGVSAPEFELPLIGGGKFSLRQALTKGPVVLAFFKISCPVCQYAFPYLERLAEALKTRNVSVTGVSQDNEENTLKFIRAFGITFPVARDDENGYAVSRQYGLTNVPTIFEIERDGRIAASIVGWSKAEVEQIHRKYAAPGAAATPLFMPSEQVAEFRPG